VAWSLTLVERGLGIGVLRFMLYWFLANFLYKLTNFTSSVSMKRQIFLPRFKKNLVSNFTVRYQEFRIQSKKNVIDLMILALYVV
jgi:hypothetical protein